MTGRTNYTGVANTGPMQGPAQITATYAHFDAIVGETRPLTSDLPATGNWVGRTIYVEATESLYVSNGVAAWKKVSGLIRAGVGSGTSSQGGDIPVTFSTPFTSACTSIVVTDSNTGGGIGPVPLKVVSRSATGAIIRVMQNEVAVSGFPTSFNYIAFGD
jgi:hypothetical protein